jgi:uncharacterized protein YigA (DUF484 family)
MTTTPDAHAVELYLEDHPNFFEDHPDLIASFKLTTALGGRTVSLQERQVEVLREKIRTLELQLVNQSRYAKDNDGIMVKIHEWTLKLLAARSEQPAESVLDTLIDCFQVPAASLRVWDSSIDLDEKWHEAPDLDAAKTLATQQATPYCGPSTNKPGLEWLSNSAAIKSLALIPLRVPGSTESFGLLVLGSPDPARFTADMDTHFLRQIGEIASATVHGQ